MSRVSLGGRLRSISRSRAAWLAWSLALLPATVFATDIPGVQNAALDQPMINALLRRPDGTLLSGIDPITGDPSFNIQAFFDTGASGVILSEQTADGFGVQRVPNVTFHDTGIGGGSVFNVSEPLRIDLAPFTPLVDVTNPAAYTQHFGPLRTQIGPLNVQNPFLQNIDVLGVPTMQGKVVVMDPKPLNAFDLSNPTLDVRIQTYVYNPGTAFKPATANSDPGIPHTNRTVRLSFASFSSFTRLEGGTDGPTLGANPFIGPNPLLGPGADPTPGITVRVHEPGTQFDRQATSSFLLDTGATASIISKAIAAKLGIHERAGQQADSPFLEFLDGKDVPNQFKLTLSGIGGDQVAAGFFLDSMLVRTEQGDPSRSNDPAHLRFVHAPVLVADIKLENAQQSLVLDGVFAMNFLVASVFFDETDPLNFGNFNPSAFDWIVFDPQSGVLGLEVSAVPEPGTILLILVGLGAIAVRLRQRRPFV